MDNQLAKPKVLVQQMIITVLVIGLFIGGTILAVHFYETSDPYIKEVLTLKGDSARGQAIFQTNCAVCHGLQADSPVGPSLVNVSKHKSKVGIIKQVIGGQTPPMPKFQPRTQDMADLLSYLETL